MKQLIAVACFPNVRPAFLALGMLGWSLASAPAMAASEGSDPAARGAYLVKGFGCIDCHTPMKMGPKGPELDMARLFSGHPEQVKLSPPPKADASWVWFGSATNTAFAGPWGISYAANLTPDKETGLGSWTDAEFVQAMKTGKHGGVGRPIMPPMPWQAMSNLSDEDLRAMFHYLQSTPPIHNKVPDYQPPAQ